MDLAASVIELQQRRWGASELSPARLGADN